jgi:hypothetical protein
VTTGNDGFEMPTSFLAFVPNPIEIKDRPELAAFANRIMFSKTRHEGGHQVFGYAIYHPKLSSFTVSKTTMGLLFENELDAGCWVHIRYFQKRKTWSGTKSVFGQKLIATGSSWSNFWTHLGMLGLQNDEPCRFLNF